jgi:hypothetical protein
MSAEVLQRVAVLQREEQEPRLVGLCAVQHTPCCSAEPAPDLTVAGHDLGKMLCRTSTTKHCTPTHYRRRAAQRRLLATQVHLPCVYHVAACKIIWVLQEAANVLQNVWRQRCQRQSVACAASSCTGTRSHPAVTCAKAQQIRY